MSTPRATQQGLGSATTLKGRPSAINTGYLAEGIDRVAGEREKGLARKAIQDETRRKEINEALSQDSGVKLPYFQGQFKKGVEEYLASDDFKNAKTYQVRNHISNLAKEQQAKEGLVNQKVMALTQGRKGFWNSNTGGHTDPATHIYSQYMDENADIDFEESLVRSDEGAEFISAPINNTPEYVNKFVKAALPNLTQKDAEIITLPNGGMSVRTTETFSKEDAEDVKEVLRSNPQLMESFAREYRSSINPNFNIRDLNNPEFLEYVENNKLSTIKPVTNVKATTPSTPRQPRPDDKLPKEFETTQKIIDLGDGSEKVVIQAGVEKKEVSFNNERVTVTATTEDENGNMQLVAQKSNGERVIIKNPDDVKDFYTEDKWAEIINTFDTKVSGKATTNFDFDSWADSVSSGVGNKDDVAKKLGTKYPELKNITDPTWDYADVAFTYTDPDGKVFELEFNVDSDANLGKDEKGRDDLREFLAKVEEDRKKRKSDGKTISKEDFRKMSTEERVEFLNSGGVRK